MTQARNDLRFHTIRDKSAKSETVYKFDGERCHVCNMLTEVGEDVSRRYCSNLKCNALIVQL
jgi:hypothetical protein